jgi:hypothetical protein
MKLLAAFFLLGIFSCVFGANESLAFVDKYLARWDEFAQGNNELAPYLRDNKAKFEEELSALLRSDRKNAVSRLVFYAVVQVGGFIDVDSELGREATKVFGKLPLTEGTKGEKLVFAGDIYYWWEERKKEFPELPLYSEWAKRDFTQNVTVRLFRSARESQKKKG